jgi:hypothetical protein
VIRSSFHERPGTRIGVGDGRISDQVSFTGPAATERDSRYRPLTLAVQEDVVRLRLTGENADLGKWWRDLVLTYLDPAATITEWLDSGEVFRWEILAPRLALVPLRGILDQTALPAGTAAVWEDDLTCLSLAGGRPDSWLEVQRHVSGLLEEFPGLRWRLRADGSSLRILLTGEFPADLLPRLHAALLPA